MGPVKNGSPRCQILVDILDVLSWREAVEGEAAEVEAMSIGYYWWEDDAEYHQTLKFVISILTILIA